MAKFIDYAGLKEFLLKIIGAPTADSQEYNLGVKDGKLVRVVPESTYTETYEFLSVSLAYDDIGNLGGTSNPTLKYTIIKETVYSDGTTTTEVVSENTGANVSYSISGSASINSSTGVVTYNSANESTSRSTVGTVTATLKYEDASYTVTATVYQTAGTYSDSYSFSGVTLTYGDISNTGGSVSPTLSYTITRTRTYSWGTTETSTVYTNTGASVTYSISGSASINSSTGQVTYSSASNTTSRASVGTVTATLKYEDASYTVTATVYQAAETYTDTYSWLSLTLTYPTANRISNTVSPNVTGNTQRNRAYSNGSYTLTNYSASSASKTFSISNAVSGVSINTSNGVVSFGNNPNDTTRTLGNVTVNAYQNGLYKTATATVTLEARTNNTTYSWISLNLSYPNANRLSGTVSPNVTSNIQKTISYSDGTSNVTYMSMGSGSSNSYSISNAASGVSINTSNGVVTFGNNPNTTSRTLGTVTLNASQNSVYKTATANVTQNAGQNTITYYTPTVNLSYSNAGATSSTLSPTYNYNQRAMTTYPNGSTSNSYYTSGGTVTFSINSTTNATINSTTGVLNFANNPLTSSRTLGNVTLNVTMNGYTGTNSKVVYQNAGTISYTNYTPTVNLNYSNAASSATTLSPTYNYNQRVMTTYPNGSTSNSYYTSGGTVTFSINSTTNATINSSTGVLTFNANPNTSSRTLGNVTLNVTRNGYTGTNSKVVYQNAGTNTITSYTPVVNLNYANAASSATTLSPTYNYNQRVMTTYPNGNTSNSYYNSGGTVTFSINSTTNATINSTTGVLTFNATTVTNSRTLGNVTLNVTRNGYTGTNSKVVYQNANTAASTEYYYLNINYGRANSLGYLTLYIGFLNGSSYVNVAFNIGSTSYYSGTGMSSFTMGSGSTYTTVNITVDKATGNNCVLCLASSSGNINYVNIIGGNMPRLNVAYWLNGATNLTGNIESLLSKLSSGVQITNAAYAFNGCTNLTNAYSAFSGCTNLTTAASAFYNCTNLTNAYSAFSGCTNLTTAASAFYNCTNLTNAASAFSGCTNLTNAAAAFYNCTNLTNIVNLCNNCRNLTTFIFIASSAETYINFLSKNITNIANAFRNCVNLTGNFGFGSSVNITCAANFFYRTSNAGRVYVYATGTSYNTIYNALGSAANNSTWNVNLLAS